MGEKTLATMENTQAVLEKVRLLFPHLSKVKDEEIAKPISVARHLGLDPVKKEVHFIPYSGTVQLIVGYTEYIKRAERSGNLNGWQVDFGKDDFGEYAEITIYRKDWQHPFKWKVYMEEARQKSPTWDKMPAFMLRKVAIAQGFRLAFPEETAELPYEEAEVPANGFNNHQQTNETIEPEIAEEENPETQPATDRQIKAIHTIAKQKGVDIKQLIADRWGLTSTKDLTKEMASQLIEELQNMEEGVSF